MTHTRNYKKWLIFWILFANIVAISHNVDTSMWPPSTLVYRIMKADYVVVGRLTKVKKHAIYIDYENFSSMGKTARFYLDTGTIHASQRLYPISVKKRNIPQETFSLPFASYSRSHPQKDGNFMDSSAHLHFDEGAEGIWILKKEVFTDHFGVVRPNDFLPIESLEAVEKAIAQVSKFISDQKEQR